MSLTITSAVQNVVIANDGRASLSARSMTDPIVLIALRELAEACGLTPQQASEARPHELASIYNVAMRDPAHASPVASRVLSSIGMRRPDLIPAPSVAIPATGPAVSVPAPDLSGFKAQIEALERAMISQGATIAAQEAEIEAIRQQTPKRLEIVRPDAPPVTITNPHFILPRVLRHLKRGTNVYCYGPAGSGKTTIGEHCAKALGVPFYAVSSVQDTSELTGFKSLTTGEYIETAFRRCFQFGGVFLFDEIDNSKSPAVTAFNMALAQRYFAFPDGIVQQHDNCYLIAGANTDGSGGNDQYQRNKLDGASLNRFARVLVPYDEALEMLIAPNKDWCALVQKIRAICIDEGIKAIISPRQTIAGGLAINDGDPLEETLEDFIYTGMTETQINTIKGQI